MFRLERVRRRPVGVRPQHANNLRDLLRTSLLSLDADNAETGQPNHRVAVEAAKTLLQVTSNKKDRGRKRDGVSSALFELMWKVGTEVLRTAVPARANLGADDEDAALASVVLRDPGSRNEQSDEYADMEKKRHALVSARKLLRFLAQMSGVEPTLSPGFLLEMTFYFMRFQMYEEAHNRLEGYISSYPYNEDALLVGYAGMLSYILWRQEAVRTRQENLGENDPYGAGQWASQSFSQSFSQSQCGYSQSGFSQSFGEPGFSFDGAGALGEDAEGDLASRHYLAAMQHFEVSLMLDNSNDMFLFHNLKLILAAGDLATAKEKLLKFIRDNESHPNGYKYLLQLHHTRLKGSPDEWIPFARKALQIDPLCDDTLALVPLVRHFEAQYVAHERIEDCHAIINLLGDRLDYGSANVWLWKTLAEALSRVIQDPLTDDVWIRRTDWWPLFHFAEPPAFLDETTVAADIEELVIAKAVCGRYLFPAEYRTLSWPQRSGLAPESLREKSLAFLDGHGMTPAAIFESEPRPVPLCFCRQDAGSSWSADAAIALEDLDDVCAMFTEPEIDRTVQYEKADEEEEAGRTVQSEKADEEEEAGRTVQSEKADEEEEGDRGVQSEKADEEEEPEEEPSMPHFDFRAGFSHSPERDGPREQTLPAELGTPIPQPPALPRTQPLVPPIIIIEQPATPPPLPPPKRKRELSEQPSPIHLTTPIVKTLASFAPPSRLASSVPPPRKKVKRAKGF
ncbi:hypothetical protein HKX48_003460 [Thoreauomyces humboldtii]|nr:hypothetical protein HKX48_003460 [Thoreauomyces humboldtii]